MNTIGIDDNLDRARIKKLLTIGLLGCVLTGVGDFILGYAVPAEVTQGLFDGILATAPNLSDAAAFAGGLLGMFGLFIEGLGYFGVYRLMADAAPRYAHILRAGIFGYIWLAPIGCHMNVGTFNYFYKYLWQVSPDMASDVLAPVYLAFCVPAFVLLAIFWIPMMVAQWKAFAEGKTPYPASAKWFTVLLGSAATVAVSALLGFDTAIGGGIGTMFLSFGNALVFGGLLATMPSEERFLEFKEAVAKDSSLARDAA